MTRVTWLCNKGGVGHKCSTVCSCSEELVTNILSGRSQTYWMLVESVFRAWIIDHWHNTKWGKNEFAANANVFPPVFLLSTRVRGSTFVTKNVMRRRSLLLHLWPSSLIHLEPISCCIWDPTTFGTNFMSQLTPLLHLAPINYDICDLNRPAKMQRYSGR